MMNLILKNSKSKKKYTELSNEILSKIDDKLNMEDLQIFIRCGTKFNLSP